MKARLNILCLLLFVAIIGSAANWLYEGRHDMWAGMKDGWNAADESGRHDFNVQKSRYISLFPNDMGVFTDSVYNEASGTKLPMQYRKIFVKGDKVQSSVWIMLAQFVLSFVLLTVVILPLVKLFNLVSAINKSIIFDWVNVKRLRAIGYSMLIAFVVFPVFSYLDYISVKEYIDIAGYTISYGHVKVFSLLIPGLSVLLFGEILAAGIRLKEEQELTI